MTDCMGIEILTRSVGPSLVEEDGYAYCSDTGRHRYQDPRGVLGPITGLCGRVIVDGDLRVALHRLSVLVGHVRASVGDIGLSAVQLHGRVTCRVTSAARIVDREAAPQL